MDPVNKYRHGVLIGNFVEDKFGQDLSQRKVSCELKKQKEWITPATNTQMTHALGNSMYAYHFEPKTQD